MLTSLALSRARFGKETKMQILVSKNVAYARFARLRALCVAIGGASRRNFAAYGGGQSGRGLHRRSSCQPVRVVPG